MVGNSSVSTFNDVLSEPRLEEPSISSILTQGEKDWETEREVNASGMTVIGSGGGGTVYRDPFGDPEKCVKIFHPDEFYRRNDLSSIESRRRYHERELKAMRMFSKIDGYTPKYYGPVITLDGRKGYEMEFIKGVHITEINLEKRQAFRSRMELLIDNMFLRYEWGFTRRDIEVLVTNWPWGSEDPESICEIRLIDCANLWPLSELEQATGFSREQIYAKMTGIIPTLFDEV